MKITVFHVFFLVLVMWAVHSHGRAYESESIVFNNTQQPYKENISTEAVSPSRLWPYDNFFLVLVWRNSRCNPSRFSCYRPPTPDRIVLHGLWPQRTGWRNYFCPPPGRTNAFNFNQLRLYQNGELVNRLNSFWRNLDNRPNQDIWKREYEKHGSCFFATQVEYFESTASMMSQIPDLSRKLDHKGIRPGAAYSFGELQRRISAATGFIPKLQCIYSRIEQSTVLYQIYFCANRYNYLENCGVHEFTSNNIYCGRGMVKLP